MVKQDLENVGLVNWHERKWIDNHEEWKITVSLVTIYFVEWLYKEEEDD